MFPIAFVAVVLLMCCAEYWLRRTGNGLATRAVGFRPPAAHRLGLQLERRQFAAYLLAALLATGAGLFMATRIGVGDATVGDNLTLQSIAAAVLGGAALRGGRGSFVGVALGAVFLALTTNVIPFLELPNAFTYLVAGGLTLVAILAYSGGEHVRQIRALWSGRRRGRDAGIAEG